jgi:hypothetical protein
MIPADRDVFQRRIILPPDLFRNLEARAQRDGFNSVQTWAVCAFQMLLDKPRCPCCDASTTITQRTDPSGL